MARFSRVQNSFNAGEWAPIMFGRSDLDRYQSALATCHNAVTLIQGPWQRRPGFAFLHQVKNHSETQRLIPFRHNSGNNYVLEVGPSYIRVFVDTGITVNTGQSITSISLANPGVVTKVAHGYANDDRLELYDFVGMPELGGREVRVASATADTFALNDSDGNAIDTTNFTAFTSGNMAEIFEITTPYAEADLPDLRFVQTDDGIYFLHKTYEPRILTRSSATSWSLATADFTDGPYLETNTTATTMTPDAATDGTPQAITGAVDNGSGLIRITVAGHGYVTGNGVEIVDVLGTTEANGQWIITVINANEFDLDGSTFTNAYVSGGTSERLVKITASAITGINDDTGFQSTDVGRPIRLQEGSTWGWGEITNVVDTTNVMAHVYETLTSTAAKTNWRLGVWSDTTGWPRTGGFFEDRLWLGGPTSYPQRVDGSKVGDGNYTNFSPSANDGTVADDNAIAYPLKSADLNEVVWIQPTDRGVAVGTTDTEWLIEAGTTTAEPITPANATAKPSTYHGSDGIAPVRVGDGLLFTQRGSRKLREFAYMFERDGYAAPDLSLFSEHILRPGVTEFMTAKIPQTIVWGVRSDGRLLGFTYERDQSVTAWHRHTIGGYSDAADTTAAKVESIALVPSADGTRDVLYAINNRYINGGTKRYIEYMSKFWETGDTAENAVHFDCAWSQVDTVATSTVTGLHFLEGETVSVYVDGKKLPDATVTNATLTATVTGLVKTVGYSYMSQGKTLPPEGASPDGSSQGKRKRVSRVGFWMQDALGVKYGNDETDAKEYLVRKWGDNYGEATALFSGVARVPFPGNTDRLGQVYWEADGPFPATILAVMPQGDVRDDT